MLWPDSASRPESGCSSQIPARWSEYDRWNLGLPDSGDIDWMLADFGTGKISMIVDCSK